MTPDPFDRCMIYIRFVGGVADGKRLWLRTPLASKFRVPYAQLASSFCNEGVMSESIVEEIEVYELREFIQPLADGGAWCFAYVLQGMDVNMLPALSPRPDQWVSAKELSA